MKMVQCLAILALTTALMALALPTTATAAVTDTFPADPWNSLQIYYSVSGVTVGSPTDTMDFTSVREYKGKTDSYNIHVTGEFRFVGGTGDNTYINCYAGLYNVPWWSGDTPEPLGSEFTKNYYHGDTVPFDIWLNVPTDQEQVQVMLTLDGSYGNWQDRSLEVKFVLDNIYYNDGSSTDTPVPESSTDPMPTGTLPLIGAGMIVCLYAVYRMRKLG